MKLSKISACVAAACGLISVPALALTANNYTNTGEFAGDTMNIRVSGATAQDPGLLASALRYCVAGSLHRYSISNNFVYFCNTNTALITPRPGTTKVAFYKYSVGGSGAGVGPVNSAAPTPFLDLAKLNASCAGTSSVADIDGTGPLSSFVDVACAAASGAVTTNAISYIGVSDVEPSFFGTPSTYNNLSSESLATVIFGVPVTKVVYEALQTQQGLPVGGLTEAAMPSLTQAQLTSIYTQQGQTWSTLGVPGLADDNVYVVRRVDSSGTQKTFEALIARTINGVLGAKNCQGDVDAFVADTGTAAIIDNATADAACAAVTAASTVITASGGGQVTRCLDGHQSRSRGAIGILTTETKQTATGNWRFVKINNIAPTHGQVAAGRYTQYADASLNTRVGANNPTAAAAGYAPFLTRLRADFSDPTLINVINAGAQTFGQAGLMSLDSLESPVPAADYTGAQGRNPWSRLVGTTLNNCQPGKAAAF
jgi:ABC-type phosphate transport system substrate-binding protein